MTGPGKIVPDAPGYLKRVLEVPKGPGWESAIPHAMALRIRRWWQGGKVCSSRSATPLNASIVNLGRDCAPVGHWDMRIERRTLAARPESERPESAPSLFPPKRHRRRKEKLQDPV